MANIVEEVKKVIEEHIQYAAYGIFDCPNWGGDPMDNLFWQDGVSVDICWGNEYFEVLGLCDDDFQEVKAFYMEKTER